MAKERIKAGEDRMKKAIDALIRELASLRAGRANPSLVEKITVEYYGAPTPINQLATISVPEARLLVIQPFDKTSIGDIEKAILKSDLGLTPNNDGKVIRLILPELTAERRKELVKLSSKKAEEAKVMVRNLRREYNDIFKKQEKNREISEDDLKRAQEDVQKLTDKYIAEIDKASEQKQKDIMEV